MGNSESANIASASAASNAVAAEIKKQKRRAKRLACCCCGMNVGGVVALIVGIVLLVYYAASLSDTYSGNTDRDLAKGLTYTGIAFLILGLLLLLIGVIIAVVACLVYRRITGKGNTKPNFKPKQYAPGTAPYPQQDWGEVPNPHTGQTAQPAQPGHSETHQVETPLIHPEIRATNSDAPMIEPDPDDSKRAPDLVADPATIRPEIS